MKALMTPFGGKGQKGFSLVELMIVVAIIGILASLAVPKFQSFQAKAKQSEAKNNLSHVYTLQMSYHADNDAYIAFGGVKKGTCSNAQSKTLGFTLSGCTKARYTYSAALSTAANGGWVGTATAPGTSIVGGGCGTADTWTINGNKDLKVTSDAVKSCG